MTRPTRRAFLGGTLATVAMGGLHPNAALDVVPRPAVRERSAWATGRDPLGPVALEAPGEVRFLLVHHTETPNGYGPEAVAPRLRNIFDYHTGTKGWPDVAYNFFVDAQGTIWEGRAGSLAGPVRGDATGGSQGYAQLCCFLGDHQAAPPTPAATASMASLLAWLADRYGIDLRAGPTIRFTSRGSSRWPEGVEVTTDPIAGHRDMSSTACPGDAAYPLVRGELLLRATAITDAARPTTTTPATSTTTSAGSTTTGPAILTTSTSSAGSPTASSDPTPSVADQRATGDSLDDRSGRWGSGWPVPVGVATVLGAGIAAISRRRRRLLR